MSLKKYEERRQENVEDAHGSSLDEEWEEERVTLVCTQRSLNNA
jgi:hypothetical protein